MLSSMSDTIQSKLEGKDTMISCSVVIDVWKTICISAPWNHKELSIKMGFINHIAYYVKSVENYVNEGELYGSTLDFNQFTSSYVMHKLNYRMSQLLNELQT